MSDVRHSPPTAKGLEYLGAVAGGLVHEIRNPLSTMNITLQLLQEDFADAPEDDERAQRVQRRVTALRREVTRLEEILDDFQRYAGMRRLDLAQIDVNRVLEEVTAFVRPECARVGVRLMFWPDRSLPLVRLDERLLKQAVLNLLLNAIQAMEEMASGGEPPDRTLELIVRTRTEGETVRIDVIDTGPGIPPEVGQKVFEIWYSRKRKGTGLGLPTARRIAEEHGGTLEFVSEPGKGSDFVLRLPLTGPPDAGA